MHKHDWIEDLHHAAYYFLRGDVHDDQYVGTVRIGADAFEEVLHDLEFERNPFAYWKETEDGRDSVGSWRMTHHTHPRRVPEGMQVHVTIFPSKYVDNGIDVYAHFEDDYSWSVLSAISHVLERNFEAERGVNIARAFLLNRSYVHLYHYQEE